MSTDLVEIVETIEFTKSTYQFREDGIVVITVKDEAHMEMPDMLEEFEGISKMTDFLPMRAVIHPGKSTSVSKEVRDYINTPKAMEVVYCQAILVDNLAHRLVATFIMKIYPVPGKIKLFDKESAAIAWVKAQ